MKKLFVAAILLIGVLSCAFAFSIEGTYSVTVDTPVGLEEGTVVVNKTPGKDAYEGVLTLFGHDNPFKDAVFDGLNFRFESRLKFTIMKIKFKCSGTITEAGVLEAVADTAFGKMAVSGSKVPAKP